jgi:hypothetical protein
MASAEGAVLGGGCHCGRVRFAVRAVFDSRYCHCVDCRRRTGAPVAASLVAFAHDFALVSGTTEPRVQRKGVQHYCGECLTPVWFGFTASVGELVSIGLGLLDDPAACPPRYHQWDAERLSWLHLADELPRYRDATVPHPKDRPG